MIDRALLEWPLVVATVVTFGTAAFVVLSWRDEPDEVSVNAAHLLPIWRVLSVVAVVVSPLVLLDMTAEMAGVSWKGALPLVPEVLTQTHAGRVWEWLLPVTLLFLLVAFMPLRESIRAKMLFVLGGTMLFLQALLSHAIDKGWFAVTLQFAHELAAGLWLGALLSLWIAARHSDTPDGGIERAARRVSRIAFWSVVAIVVTGVYTAYNGLGFDRYRLLFSAYGQALMAKVFVFAVVLAIGAYNRYWLVPAISDSASREALLRNVGLESLILVLVVLGLAALLANTPPAHAGAPGGHSMMAMFIVDPRSRSRKKLDVLQRTPQRWFRNDVFLCSASSRQSPTRQ
jgi:putative copper resistance protein D